MLSTVTVNLRPQSICVSVLSASNNCPLFPAHFFASLCPGAPLYQALAAAVVLDTAGSRYRKTARAQPSEKSRDACDLPKALAPIKASCREESKRQADNCVWAAAYVSTEVLAITLCRVLGSYLIRLYKS